MAVQSRVLRAGQPGRLNQLAKACGQRRREHVQQISALPLVYEFSRHLPPRAAVEPGETIRVESEDALSGQIRSPGDRRDKSKVPYSNPVADNSPCPIAA